MIPSVSYLGHYPCQCCEPIDGSGSVAASYAYGTWGAQTSVSESIPGVNGWVYPYRYDGRDGVRCDASERLYWTRMRHEASDRSRMTRLVQ